MGILDIFGSDPDIKLTHLSKTIKNNKDLVERLSYGCFPFFGIVHSMQDTLTSKRIDIYSNYWSIYYRVAILEWISRILVKQSWLEVENEAFVYKDTGQMSGLRLMKLLTPVMKLLDQVYKEVFYYSQYGLNSIEKADFITEFLEWQKYYRSKSEKPFIPIDFRALNSPSMKSEYRQPFLHAFQDMYEKFDQRGEPIFSNTEDPTLDTLKTIRDFYFTA